MGQMGRMQREPIKERLTPRVSLHLATSFEAAWQHVLLPWFEKEIPRASEQQASVAVVTPFRSHAYFLRSKLLTRGISLLSVKFLSPAEVREILQRGSNLNLPLREHLRLLFAIAAERVAATIASDQPAYL